jgi:putative nucleotidyltransferase-like protein
VNDAAIPLPSLNKVAIALREITETLACEFRYATDETPEWDEFEWRIAQAVVSMQGVSSLLQAGLRWAGPPRWRQFLEEQQNHIAGRHARIDLLLKRIDSQARGEGIALVALKGAALHASGVYDIGERPMADIDLLIRDADLKTAIRLIEGCDFELTFTTWRHYLFECRPQTRQIAVRLGEHIDNPIKIELHTSVRERLPLSEIDITACLFPDVSHPGLNAYRSPASLMMHLLLHCAGNMRAHALRLIQLCDIARLAARFTSLDWQELLSARPNGQGLWWAASPLILTARYFPAAIPPCVIARLDKECPWLLRRVARRLLLADVSWSNIRVYALPGIEWSRTPGEALRFIVSRIWPTRDARIELYRFAAHHPGASKVPWYGISQGARILRWILFRPPRVQTLITVRAALAQTT